MTAVLESTRENVGRAPRGAAKLTPVWWALALLTAVEGIHQAFGVGRPDALFTQWVHDIVVVASAALCLARARQDPRLRIAWLYIGAGQACWAASTLIWSLRYNAMASPPYPTASDYLSLVWYPLVAIGIAQLARAHVLRFELGRWTDGLSVVLVVLTAGVAMLLQPLAEVSQDSDWATAVNFSFPVLDTLLIGGILGICGLLSWRLGHMWLALGAGCIIATVPDVVFAVVEEAAGTPRGGGLDFAWTAGAALIAYAAWASDLAPEARTETVGWRAIALAVAAQILAAGLQIAGLFFEIGWSERIVTLVILAVATVQIVATRPRMPTATG